MKEPSTPLTASTLEFDTNTNNADKHGLNELTLNGLAVGDLEHCPSCQRRVSLQKQTTKQAKHTIHTAPCQDIYVHEPHSERRVISYEGMDGKTQTPLFHVGKTRKDGVLPAPTDRNKGDTLGWYLATTSSTISHQKTGHNSRFSW